MNDSHDDQRIDRITEVLRSRLDVADAILERAFEAEPPPTTEAPPSAEELERSYAALMRRLEPPPSLVERVEELGLTVFGAARGALARFAATAAEHAQLGELLDNLALGGAGAVRGTSGTLGSESDKRINAMLYFRFERHEPMALQLATEFLPPNRQRAIVPAEALQVADGLERGQGLLQIEAVGAGLFFPIVGTKTEDGELAIEFELPEHSVETFGPLDPGHLTLHLFEPVVESRTSGQ